MSWLADLIGIRTLLVDGSEQEKRSKLAITAGDGVELAAVDNPVADRIELTITMPAGAGDATSLRGIVLDAESFALPEDGEVVTYDSGTNSFVLSAGGGGGSGDATSLQAVPLDAATVGAPNDGDVIVYDSIAGEYKAASPGSLGLPSGTADDVLVYDGADWVADKLVNAHIDAAAAIAGTKIAPNFGAQPISTTGNLTVGASSSFVRSTADSTGSLASLRKDRSGAKLESGDTIGAWRFQPHDGSGYLITAQLTADVVGETSGDNIPSRVRLQVGDNTAGLRTVLEATATSTILRCGATVAGTGDIRMGRGAEIVALNNAETQNYDLIVLSGDVLTIGDATEGTGNVYQTGNGDHTFGIDGTGYVRIGKGLIEFTAAGGDGVNAGIARESRPFFASNLDSNCLTGWFFSPPDDTGTAHKCLFVGDYDTPPASVDSSLAGAWLWADGTELTTHRAGVIDYLALRTATGLATTGHVRAGNALSIVARNNVNGTDRTLLNWASDTFTVGDSSSALEHTASQQRFYVGGTLRATLAAASLSFDNAMATINFNSTVSNPLIRANNTSGTPQPLTLRGGGKSAGTGNGADLLLQGGRHSSGSGGAVRLQYNPDDATPADRIVVDSTGIGFFGATPIAKPSAGDLASLLTALENLGLITDTS